MKNENYEAIANEVLAILVSNNCSTYDTGLVFNMVYKNIQQQPISLSERDE